VWTTNQILKENFANNAGIDDKFATKKLEYKNGHPPSPSAHIYHFDPTVNYLKYLF